MIIARLFGAISTHSRIVQVRRFEGCFSFESKASVARNRIATHVDEPITKHGCSFFAKITEGGKVSIYICTDRSIDRMGKFVSENPWKKKSRYRAAVTVMRLSTDSLLRHHINIRSNLFERIFPPPPGRNLITIYGHVLYPVTDSGSSLRRYPPPPIRDSQSFKLDTFLSTNLPLIPIQSKFL